jgi:hypothetical protein
MIVLMYLYVEGHWQERKNRKELFDRLAREYYDLNPLLPESWYSIVSQVLTDPRVIPALT